MNIKNLLKFGIFSAMLAGGLTFGANNVCVKCGAALTCPEGSASACRSCDKPCYCSECEKDGKSSQEAEKSCVVNDCKEVQTLEQDKGSDN